MLFLCLDQSSRLEGLVGAVFGDGAEALSRNGEGNALTKLGYKNTLLLEVGAASYLATRIKLRRTSAVAVAATHLGALAGDVALLSHR